MMIRLPSILIAVLITLGSGFVKLSFASDPVLFPSLNDRILPLAGDWQFKYIPSSNIGSDEDFYKHAFDRSSWKPIAVPSHWELKGFAEPKYKKVDEGTGLYYRTFKVPPSWKNQRIMLRFDGVLYGLTAWINGKEVGEWASSYNPVTFDVTDAVRGDDSENSLAVRVTTRSKGWEFDTNDCWALSGIYREVTLFAVPEAHLNDYTARTVLKPDGSAEVQVEVVASKTGQIKGNLLSPDGKARHDFAIALDEKGRGITTVALGNPTLWTAESPNLYELNLDLQVDGKSAQQFKDHIGLRQVTIDNGIFKLNGRPIKLRGIDHHDLWPDEGRVATEEKMRRDLEMMRDANVNFIRTSHYPPHPRFIQLCDEMGFYVMCEVPFGHGDNHLTDPAYEQALLTRASATVMRDKNRPSVIIWSVGNENPLTELGTKTALFARKLDPTRPVCFPTVGSYFGKNIDQFISLPEEIGVFSPHYPGAKRITEYSEKLQRPIIFTEYAHSLGLAFDNMQTLWELMYKSPRVAGGAVWMFQDQGILRDVKATGQPANGSKYLWPDESHYFDTAGTDGCDGVVYSDRTPQVDYWQVRKVYSPIQITERNVKASPGRQSIVLHFENRFDFRSLQGINLNWTLEANARPVQTGRQSLHARPRSVEEVAVTIDLPEKISSDIFTLKLQCINETGQNLLDRTVRLETDEATLARQFVSSLDATARVSIAESAQVTSIHHPDFTLSVNQQTGEIALNSAGGNVLAGGFYPHVGRRLTMAEELRVARVASTKAADLALKDEISTLWRDSFLKPDKIISAEAKRIDQGALLTLKAMYHRTDAPSESLNGAISLLVNPNGTIDVNYEFICQKTTGQLVEAGLCLITPAELGEFRWIGDGPYPGYPGKDLLNEFGIHQLNKRDLHFQGNHRRVDLAMLTAAPGDGLLFTGSNMDVAVENIQDGIMLSHNALVAGRGNKGANTDIRINAATLKEISGTFTLTPLATRWPAMLTRWLGSPAAITKINSPFHRSYDQ